MKNRYLKDPDRDGFQSQTRAFVSELWPPNVQELCSISARQLGVSSAVHSEDFIFKFLYDNPVFESKSGAVNYYFTDGKNSAEKVKEAVNKWVMSSKDNFKILEFAAGYGAVTRHAIDLLAPSELHSCDIHVKATQFLSREFGVETVLSCDEPESLAFPDKYDMIFALSFFSHMPEFTWERWLARLYKGLKTNGVLLFTTHGKLSMKYFPLAKLDSKGYWFKPDSEQKDLDTKIYGQTITSKKFVDERIAKLPGVEVLEYEEGGWWEHQDLYIVRKCD